jgi:hypothetical protein
MKRPAALFPIVLALGAIIVAPRCGAQAQNGREEGPIEIEKCQTISKPGSYKLVNNLVARASADCIVIVTDSVTIDLAGFSISSAGGSGGEGVRAMGSPGQFLGIAVRNGSISGFSAGVELEATTAPIVEGLRITGLPGCSAGIDTLGAGGIVRGNTVINCAEGFIVVGTITGNYAANNNGGFSIDAGSTVIGNTARNNRITGIGVTCPSNVIDNTATGSQFNLLTFVGTADCNLTNNVAP